MNHCSTEGFSFADILSMDLDRGKLLDGVSPERFRDFVISLFSFKIGVNYLSFQMSVSGYGTRWCLLALVAAAL